MQPYGSRLWAVMSPAGFVSSFISARQLIEDLPSFASALTWLGMAISLSGLSGIIYVIIFLTSSYERGIDGFATEGIYSVVRHPLYLSGIVLNLGMLFAAGARHGWTCIQLYPLAVVGIICYVLASRIEDTYNVAKFGKSYQRYAEKVPGLNPARRLFPRLIGNGKQ